MLGVCIGDSDKRSSRTTNGEVNSDSYEPYLFLRVVVFLEEESDTAVVKRARVVEVTLRIDLLGVGRGTDELEHPPLPGLSLIHI